jgi:uracil-DNA glycosylase family 4
MRENNKSASEIRQRADLPGPMPFISFGCVSSDHERPPNDDLAAHEMIGEPQIEAFARLVDEARACRACPRMEGRVRLLGPANGALHPRVCFVAEAPGRRGGDRTAIPLCGDQSGRNFERLLTAAGLDRDAVFITNAVLCNPRDAAGRNAPPSTAEIRNCSGFLAATLDLLQPSYVVALGAVALRALALIEPHGATLAGNVGDLIPWHGRWLIPLYHPGPRAQLHRPFARQAEDFRRLGALLRRRDGAAPDLPVAHRSPRSAADEGEYHPVHIGVQPIWPTPRRRFPPRPRSSPAHSGEASFRSTSAHASPPPGRTAPG